MLENAIARNTEFGKTDLNNDFMSSFKSPCNELHIQTNVVFERVMQWLSSLGDTSAQHHFIKPDHYKLINRHRMCMQIHQMASLRELVLEQLDRREFWAGHERGFVIMRDYSKSKHPKTNISQLMNKDFSPKINPSDQRRLTSLHESQSDLNYNQPLVEHGPTQETISNVLSEPNLITTQLPLFEDDSKPLRDLIRSSSEDPSERSKTSRLVPIGPIRNFKPSPGDQDLDLTLSLGLNQSQLSKSIDDPVEKSQS